MFKLDLEKAEEPEIRLPTSADHFKIEWLFYIYAYIVIHIMIYQITLS